MQMALEAQSCSILRFGVFEVDVRAGEVRKQGVRIKLQEQPFHVLSVLLRRPGEIVTREELRAQLWQSDTFVDFDNGLNTSINKLREALGDSADSPRFVETLPRRGYRFIAPVNGADGPARGAATGVSTAARTSSRKMVVAVLVLAAGIAGGLLWHSRKPPLTEKDTIVLGDFANSTGDPVFDDTLKQGLRVQLEQSPFLNILSDEKAGEELQLMGRAKDERLTKGLARDLCQRVGSKAILTGSISSLGTHYVVGLSALNCATGDALGSEQVEADSREHVLRVLSQSATKMRRKLGESLATIQKYDAPVEQATTPSLDALKAYSLGLKTWSLKGADASIPLFKRAVELDPNFAMAYGRLGTAYATGTVAAGLSNLNIRKAYELRERVSDRERLYLESHYYHFATEELERAAEIYELWEQTYPRDPVPSDNLVSVYSSLGNLEKALEQAQLTMRLSPERVESYEDLSSAYTQLNDWNNADTVLRRAEGLKLESENLSWSRYFLSFQKGDVVGMNSVAATTRNRPHMEAPVLAWQAFLEIYQGHPKRSLDLWRRSVESAKKDGTVERAATLQVLAGRTEGILGFSSQAYADAEAALRLAKNQGTEAEAALILTLIGDIPRVRKLAAELDKKYPLSDPIQRNILPTIRAEIALHLKDADSAIEQLRVASPYDFGMGMSGPTDTCYVRGQAFLMQRNGRAAAEEFQKIVDHPGLMGLDPVGVLAHLGLARAYALQADTAKSRAAYHDFLTLWKDADADIPILQQAKAEYAKLK
jgi:DNA-binding winged helix-turn-helix (wHTH) protein/tetratricopeptide (TPR) repeat protein